MTPNNSAETLIARLRALPVAERAVALAQACAGHPALADLLPAIQAALAAAPDSPAPVPVGQLSPQDLAQVLGAALEVSPAEVTGARIGPYKLLQEIGRGGFGVVWMAEQNEPIRRRVALKIIKAGMDTREVVARFEAERQALALMDHPNIARVFDAGATEAGRPFFVMELVRGVAITLYCDENRLPAEARLRLFIAVCSAVQHAHQKGIIHRDLKPSNILVTLHDGVPVPKIIDFGIAKATSGVRLTDRTLFTQFHAFIGTPAYTSPEQMEMSGLDVDTRSDIYSLGVLLYELLTGQPPFDSDALVKSGLEAMRRTIREIDPPRPSHCLGTLPSADRTSVAQQRSTDAGKLSVLLRGDLDWIVMCCLEKDRSRRYETANGLARDIQRHLEDEPVAARPPSNTYRLRKFIRRYKYGFAAAMAVAASLVAGLIVSSVLLVRAVVAERAETRLRHEAETARELETKRSSRTALSLANRLLDEGKTAEALAYFVHAARKDPGNTAIAPRLASVLTSRNFLIPEGTPFQCGSRVLALRYSPDGRSIYVGTEDGTLRVIGAASGAVEREFHLGKRVKYRGWIFARDAATVCAVRFTDNTVGVFDVGSGRFRWPPLELDAKVLSGESGPDGPPTIAVDLSPDGRWLHARSLTDFWLWDAATGEARLRRVFKDFLFLNLSPDGRRLALVSDDALQIWSLPECTPDSASIPITRKLAPAGSYLIPAFSPDGRFLAVCDPWEAVHVFEAATGRLLRSWPHRDVWMIPGSIGFIPDGRLFTASVHSSELWNLESGQFTNVAFVWRDMFRSNHPSADGKLVLTRSTDGLAQLWDTATGQSVANPILQQKADFCTALSGDGTQIAIGTADGTLHRLRVGRGAARPLALPRSPDVIAAPFMAGEPTRLLRITSDHASVFDVGTGRETGGRFALPMAIPVQALNQHEAAFQIRPDLKYAVADIGGGQWQAWEFAAGGVTRVTPMEASAPGRWVHFSPVGDLVAFSPDAEHQIGVWNLRTGAPAGPLCSYEGALLTADWGISFGSGGKHIAVGTEKGEVVLWEIATGRLVTVIKTRSTAMVLAVHLSRDGTRVLAANGLGEVGLWDAVTGEARSRILETSELKDAEFSPDERIIATWGPRAINMWDSQTLAPVGETIPSGSPGGGVRFSADGKSFVNANYARSARVWDVRTGQPLTEPMRHDDLGTADLSLVAFSPDGHFVRTETFDGRYYVWAVPPALPEGTKIPEWLLQLASICATKKINDVEQCVDAPEFVAQIDDVRRQLAALPADAPLAEWGRWFLDDSTARSIAPGFTITSAEVEKLATNLPPATPLRP